MFQQCKAICRGMKAKNFWVAATNGKIVVCSSSLWSVHCSQYVDVCVCVGVSWAGRGRAGVCHGQGGVVSPKHQNASGSYPLISNLSNFLSHANYIAAVGLRRPIDHQKTYAEVRTFFFNSSRPTDHHLHNHHHHHCMQCLSDRCKVAALALILGQDRAVNSPK